MALHVQLLKSTQSRCLVSAVGSASVLKNPLSPLSLPSSPFLLGVLVSHGHMCNSGFNQGFERSLNKNLEASPAGRPSQDFLL